MSVVKEQDHQNNQAGQTAMKRLSKPIKVWVTIAQVLTIFSALLAFSLSVVRRYFFVGSNGRRTAPCGAST